MASKNSQPLLLQIHKERFLGSKVEFGIFGSEVWKNPFLHNVQKIRIFKKLFFRLQTP